jgi:hypothetical protein
MSEAARLDSVTGGYGEGAAPFDRASIHTIARAA